LLIMANVLPPAAASGGGRLPIPVVTMEKKTYSVLLVDDSDDDRWFMRRALKGNSRFSVAGEACDGEVAIAFLSGDGIYGDREKYPFPDVVLLDLKMPRVTGHEVLGWLRTQSFKGLFVAVLSGSILPEDIARSMALGAHAHFKKNALEEERASMVRALEDMLDQAAVAVSRD
jgi:CheY-like chemotaxis protein